MGKVVVPCRAMEIVHAALRLKLPPASPVFMSAQQVYKYLHAQHSLISKEISDVVAIRDTFDSSAPFANNAHSYLLMLMDRRAKLWAKLQL
jgi:hypothetical protein